LAFQRIDSNFGNGPLSCAAWLYLPEKIEKPPIVVMAHGFAAERTFGLPAFAERFASAGLAVLLFDYRNFGDSQGEPRNWVSPARHLSDWKAALTHVRTLSQIDTKRIALWGSSFSGGHVICTAAEESDICAIVSQVPYVGGNTDVKPPLSFVVKYMWGLVLNKIKLALTGKPHYIPAVGKPGEFAIMTAPEAQDYWRLVPKNSTWKNRVPVSILKEIGHYQPIAIAHKVMCPALLVLAEQDKITPPDPIRECVRQLPKGELLSIDTGHFKIYQGKGFEQTVAHELEFLLKHLKNQ